MHSYLTHLECSRCKKEYPADELQNLCECGAPLFARYDLKQVTRVLSTDDLGFRVHSLWRYKELLPVRKPENIISLFEGFTPLVESRRIGAELGLTSLLFKDESFNPTGSFKARGLSVAVSRAKELGVKEICLPTAGNAGGAAAAYAARAGMMCHVYMPEDTPQTFVSECKAYGADLRMVKGVITDAAHEMQPEMKGKGWFDVSTCKEPYRVEGKKTILYELGQQFNWHLPDVIVFPTGGGTGIVAGWKACQELKELGWLVKAKLPRLVAVQAEGCAPVVRGYEMGSEDPVEWKDPKTSAWGLRVPRAVAGFLILRAIRESNGAAVAVSEEEICDASAELASKEGIFAAPEASAGLAGIRRLVKKELVGPEETVILLITGCGVKYPAG